MVSKTYLMGALLLAAPLFSQANKLPAFADPQLKEGVREPVWFQLTEDRDQVGRLLGKPAQVSESGKGLYSWQYQLDSTDEEFSHTALFRKSDGKLISITRQYDTQRTVDEWFPGSETVVCHFPDATKPTFSVRARKLSGGRVLIAMGASKKGQLTSQILLIRESELGNFYPWIAAQLTK